MFVCATAAAAHGRRELVRLPGPADHAAPATALATRRATPARDRCCPGAAGTSFPQDYTASHPRPRWRARIHRPTPLLPAATAAMAIAQTPRVVRSFQRVTSGRPRWTGVDRRQIR